MLPTTIQNQHPGLTLGLAPEHPPIPRVGCLAAGSHPTGLMSA